MTKALQSPVSRYKRMWYKRLTFAVATTSLCACSQWPDHGAGGFAEHQAAAIYPTEATTQNSSSITDSRVRIRMDAEIARNHLDSLILAGATRCFPASVQTLKLRQTRIEREIAGGLAGDAAVHLIIQRDDLGILREQVRLANSTYTCAVNPHAAEPSHFQLVKAQQLLNIDNQFATDSPALNPKYTQNIRQALALLTPFNDIQFIITGHTDSEGTDARNWSLSNERAKAVANFLIEQGVGATAVSLYAKASTEPFSFAAGDEHNLVNRRVTIQIIYGQKSLVLPAGPVISHGEI